MANLHIINFIQGLSPVEIRLVEDYLNKTQALFDETKHEVMEVKLFKYIIHRKKELVTDEMIIAETGTKRVTDLKNNLFSKVLEALTLDKFITNTELFAENDIIIFTLKKKLLLCKISTRSLSQAKTEFINELLEDIILKSKEFELYDILVEALTTKKYFNGTRKGLQEFEKLNDELAFYEYCNKALYNAADDYFRLTLNNYFVKTLSNSEADKHIAASIKRMESDYKKTRSEQINYYIHILRYALYERQNDYKSAIEQCNKLLVILKKHKSIYRTDRIGFAYLNLCQFKIYQGKYTDALKDVLNSQKYFIENSLNYAVSKEQEFYTNFYSQEYPAANKCLNALLSHSKIDTGEFRRSKYIYYRACVFFAEKDFKEALMLLNESLEIEKDKTRWNISLRILNIMIFIEMNKINEVFTALEALRKYMERTGKTDEVSDRDVLIVKLLRELEKDGFEMDPENKTTTKLLKQLAEKDSTASWEYFSSELIPFHEWLQGKVKKKK